MIVKESHELHSQVFGGGDRRDALDNSGVRVGGESWMMLPAASGRRMAKKS